MNALVAATFLLTVGHEGERLLEGWVSAAPSRALPYTALGYGGHSDVKGNLLLVERNHCFVHKIVVN